MEEPLVRELSYQICKLALGEGHLATKISKHGIAPFLPEGTSWGKAKETEEIDIVESFEMKSITHIG
jgi:hypothetical protein